MLTLREALNIVNAHIPARQVVCNTYGEAQGKYIFTGQFSDRTIPPGGGNWTVNKETGECKFEYLEREGINPWSPIRGYKKLELPKK